MYVCMYENGSYKYKRDFFKDQKLNKSEMAAQTE